MTDDEELKSRAKGQGFNRAGVQTDDLTRDEKYRLDRYLEDDIFNQLRERESKMPRYTPNSSSSENRPRRLGFFRSLWLTAALFFIIALIMDMSGKGYIFKQWQESIKEFLDNLVK